MSENYTLEAVKQYNAELILPIADMLAQLTGREERFGEEELRAIIENPASQLFIMRDDEQVIGMLTLGRYTSPTGTKTWVEDVVVHKEYRGKDLGRKLINHAIDYCRQHYAPCTLMLTSNPMRVSANALYRSSGFEPKHTNVYKMTIE
ncbi:MAG: GNAT family N-acetyltransferase [Alistipes sp.]|nr:GNAT family N-acetyltransferase [Alistipes sp.]